MKDGRIDTLVERQGILCVVSGPSGSGKTTLCRRMSRHDPRCVYSVSCTTRAPREGEVDGRDYHFLSGDEFENNVRGDAFLEHATVHGRSYGTLKSWVTDRLERGIDVLMDIDVQGAAQIRASGDSFIQSSLVDVFILPPTVDELRERLVNRATEDERQVTLRLRNALKEMAEVGSYRYTIVSGAKEVDFARFEAILQAERCDTGRQVLPVFPQQL